MNSTLAILLATAALVACATEPNDSARGQALCTEGDPSCGDPGGGGSSADVSSATESYASSVVLQYQQQGYHLVAQTASACPPGQPTCLVSLDFGSFRVCVTCHDYGPPTGVVCTSHVH